MSKETMNPTEKQQLLMEAEKYSLQSLKIYPTYFPPHDILGNIYFEMGNYEYSVHYFSQAVKMRNNDERILGNLEAAANVAVTKGDYTSADKAYRLLVRYRKGQDRSRIFGALGELHGKHLNDMTKAKEFLRKSITADPNNAAAYQKMGIVFAMTGAADSALYNFNRSLEIEPENARVLLNIGILYGQLGDQQRAQEYISRARAIDPNVQGGS